jgi:uncharacterized protein YndB with AHSA1/START domain
MIEGPRSLVFEAYSSIEHLSRWWGPDGFSTTTRSFEFYVGGIWDFVMHGPDGTDYPNRIEWRDITPPERLVFMHGTGANDFDAFESTVLFAARGNTTEVTLRSLFNTREQRDELVARYHALEGAEQHLAKLADYIATIR